jgi:hypothetical protein
LIIEAVVLVAVKFFEPLIFPVFVSSSAQDQKPGLSIVTGPGRRIGPASVHCDGLACGVGDDARLGVAVGVTERCGSTQRLAELDLAGWLQPAVSRAAALAISASAVGPIRARRSERTTRLRNIRVQVSAGQGNPPGSRSEQLLGD